MGCCECRQSRPRNRFGLSQFCPRFGQRSQAASREARRGAQRRGGRAERKGGAQAAKIAAENTLTAALHWENRRGKIRRRRVRWDGLRCLGHLRGKQIVASVAECPLYGPNGFIIMPRRCGRRSKSGIDYSDIEFVYFKPIRRASQAANHA